MGFLPDSDHARDVVHAGIANPRWLCDGGENVPGVPGAYATHNFTHLARISLMMVISALLLERVFKLKYGKSSTLYCLLIISVWLVKYINIVLTYSFKAPLLLWNKKSYQLVNRSTAKSSRQCAWFQLLICLDERYVIFFVEACVCDPVLLYRRIQCLWESTHSTQTRGNQYFSSICVIF